MSGIKESLLTARNCALAFLVSSVALLSLLVHAPRHSFHPVGPQRIQLPMPGLMRISDPIFKKSCYNYVDVTATNVCCKMKTYDLNDVAKCAQAFNATQNLLEPPNSIQHRNSSSEKRFHLVFIGDSHMRYIFNAVSLRLASPELRYKRREQTTWGGVQALIRMRNERLKSILETKHLSIPILLTYYVDFFLENFTGLMKRWETGEEIKPTIAVVDGGLHHLAKRFDLNGTQYRKLLVKLAPYFTRLAATVPVYYKLIDDQQAIRKRRFRYSADRINLLNQIAIRELRGTGVTIWDSTLPLSIQYTDACLKKSRSTPPLFKWKCKDVGHLGYIFVEQLADMLYNSVCNRYLNLGEGYCGHDTSS